MISKSFKTSVSFAILVLCLSVGVYILVHYSNAVQRASFSKEVKRFIEQGPRNTLWDGYRLCIRVQKLEKERGEPHPISCDDLYDDRSDKSKN